MHHKPPTNHTHLYLLSFHGSEESEKRYKMHRLNQSICNPETQDRPERAGVCDHSGNLLLTRTAAQSHTQLRGVAVAPPFMCEPRDGGWPTAPLATIMQSNRACRQHAIRAAGRLTHRAGCRRVSVDRLQKKMILRASSHKSKDERGELQLASWLTGCQVRAKIPFTQARALEK